MVMKDQTPVLIKAAVISVIIIVIFAGILAFTLAN